MLLRPMWGLQARLEATDNITFLDKLSGSYLNNVYKSNAGSLNKSIPFDYLSASCVEPGRI